MKFFKVLTFATLLIASEAVITKPDAVLIQLDAFETEVLGYQGNLQIQIKTLRELSSSSNAEYYKNVLTTIKQNIQDISVSDVAIRTSLDAQTASACITNLKNFVDQIIELSGYAISNCIETRENSTAAIPTEFLLELDAIEKEVNNLAQIIINALIGRNIFTEGDAIIARVQEQLAQKKTDFDTIVAELNVAVAEFTNNLKEDLATLDSCFTDIDTSIASGIDAIQLQISVCSKFGGRGARSAIPFRAIDFFPQLN